MSDGFAFFSLLLILSAVEPASAVESEARTVQGHGGYPLSETVTSMWGVIDEPASDRDQVLTFLIYFRGASGWHDGKWFTKVSINSEPAIIEYSKGSIILHAQYSKHTRRLTVFGKDVPVRRANVVLVDNVDRPGKEVVKEIGRYPLKMPIDGNPALFLIEAFPKVQAMVIRSK